MERIARKEFHATMGEQSRVLASLPLSPLPPVRRKGAAALQCVRVRLDAEPFRAYIERTMARDLEDLVLNGAQGSDDPFLNCVDGLIRQVELAGRAVDAGEGHPFDLLVSTIAHIDEEERPLWVVAMHPAVWMDARLEHDKLWYQSAVSEEDETVGGARLIITPRMEDRTILMFRPDKVDYSISDVNLSMTQTEPVGDRANLLLRLVLDTDHAQVLHNLG